jgi:hypothetical protein
MYLRHTTICKDGKTHTYWRLVRSVRHGNKVRQETVAHLGELDGQGRARARQLALQITGEREQYGLFEATTSTIDPVPVIPVRHDQVRLERMRGSAMSGWAGVCGAHWSSTVSAQSILPQVARACRGRRWRRSW